MPTTGKNGGKVVSLRGETGSLRDDLAKLTSTLEAVLSERIDRPQHRAHDLSERMGGEISHAKSWADHYVHDRPVRACGVAFGLGVLAGLFLLRRP